MNRIKSYKKLDYAKFVNESYGIQNYMKNMNTVDGCTFFAHRAQMIRTVQMNFKKLYTNNEHNCICGEEDDQVHLIFCQSYAHLREELDLEGSDLDLVRYYQRIIRERVQVEEREQEEVRNRRKFINKQLAN